MNIKKFKDKKKKLISKTNPEWQYRLDLQAAVQKDFKKQKSLSISTYDKILNWKLHNQTSRIAKIRNFSPDSLIKTITECYCEIDHHDDEMKTRIKLSVLISIPWIGVGISSAIMALHEPEMYTMIDPRTWSVLFHKEKKTFSGNDYIRYQKSIRELAAKLHCDLQEVDYILWEEYDA